MTDEFPAHRSFHVHVNERAGGDQRPAAGAGDACLHAHPMHFVGRHAMRGLFEQAREMGEWGLIAAPANRMPCAASYLRRPEDATFRAMKFDVLTVHDDLIAATTTFGPELFSAFGLEPTLEP